MKKTIAIAFCLIGIQSLFAQKKLIKKTVLSEQTIITNKARAWFKDVYVQVNFKDPYSYKLMKFDVYPVTNEAGLKDIIKNIDYKIDELDTSKTYSSYQLKIKTIRKDREYNEKYGSRDSVSVANAKSYTNMLLKERDEMLKEYNTTIQAKKEAELQLNSLTPATKDKTLKYIGYLDCYGRNGYGNIALNKYVFDISKSGEVTDVRTMD